MDVNRWRIYHKDLIFTYLDIWRMWGIGGGSSSVFKNKVVEELMSWGCKIFEEPAKGIGGSTCLEKLHMLEFEVMEEIPSKYALTKLWRNCSCGKARVWKKFLKFLEAFTTNPWRNNHKDVGAWHVGMWGIIEVSF